MITDFLKLFLIFALPISCMNIYIAAKNNSIHSVFGWACWGMSSLGWLLYILGK